MKQVIKFSFLLFTIIVFTNCSKDVLLMRASYDSNIMNVKKQVEKGAEVDFNKIYNETPLYRAAANGSLDIVTYLISKGANVNYQKQGFILKSSENIGGRYKYLIEKVPNGGRTVLTVALLGWGGFDKVISYLLEKGVKVNYKYIQTNAQPIIRMGSFTTGEEIGGEGIGTYVPTKEEIETPLTFAITTYKYHYENKHDDKAKIYKSIIQELIKYGADKNAINGKGLSAIQLANIWGLKEINDVLK